MLPSWLQEALECPHKTHLNSRSSSLLRQMQSLWGRICNGEFKNGIEPSVLGLQYDRWGNREEEEMPGEGLRWLAVWNTSPKQLRSRDCIHFIYFFFFEDNAIQTYFMLFLFAHPPSTEVGCIPDSRAYAKHCNSSSPTDQAGNKSWVPPQSSRPELLTVHVGATRASTSTVCGRASAAFCSSKINISCSLIRKVLLEEAWVSLVSLLPLTYIYIFFNYQ